MEDIKFKIGDNVVHEGNLAHFILKLNDNELRVHRIDKIEITKDQVLYESQSNRNLNQTRLVNVVELPQYLLKNYNMDNLGTVEFYKRIIKVLGGLFHAKDWNDLESYRRYVCSKSVTETIITSCYVEA